VIADHGLDHLPDRHRLAPVALDVAGEEPVEALVGIVGWLLLRHQEHESITVREGRPAGTEVIDRCVLGAAMQNDHQRSLRLRRDIFEHAQPAGIRSEAVHLGEAARARLGQVAARAHGVSCQRQPFFPLVAILGHIGQGVSEAWQGGPLQSSDVGRLTMTPNIRVAQ
jgi:hypothetical protein